MILLDQIQATLPSDDNVKYSTMADKLCWPKVKVGDYSPDECKEEWQRISTKVDRLDISFQFRFLMPTIIAMHNVIGPRDGDKFGG